MMAVLLSADDLWEYKSRKMEVGRLKAFENSHSSSQEILY